MQNATILYLVDTETTDETIQTAAETARARGAFLRCLLYAPVPILPFSATGGVAYGTASIADQWPAEVAAAQVGVRARAEAIEVIFSRVEVSGDITPVFCVPSEIRQNVSAFARSADVMIIADNMRDTTDVFSECVHAGLFSSPLGILLNTPSLALGGHVFLAWDDSDAAASAVHKGLPLLKAAREITIGCFDPVLNERGEAADPGIDIAAWLTRHGCMVELAHYPSGGAEIGACILGKAQELGCDLIVMGAYGHSRMRQAIFGGTTRTLLEQSEQAVFLGH